MRIVFLLALLVPPQLPADAVITPSAPIALFNGQDLSNWEADVRGRAITVWVNGDLVNNGVNASVDHGKIAAQAEGAEVEFRTMVIGPLPPV